MVSITDGHNSSARSTYCVSGHHRQLSHAHILHQLPPHHTRQQHIPQTNTTVATTTTTTRGQNNFTTGHITMHASRVNMHCLPQCNQHTQVTVHLRCLRLFALLVYRYSLCSKCQSWLFMFPAATVYKFSSHMNIQPTSCGHCTCRWTLHLNGFHTDDCPSLSALRVCSHITS